MKNIKNFGSFVNEEHSDNGLSRATMGNFIFWTKDDIEEWWKEENPINSDSIPPKIRSKIQMLEEVGYEFDLETGKWNV